MLKSGSVMSLGRVSRSVVSVCGQRCFGLLYSDLERCCGKTGQSLVEDMVSLPFAVSMLARIGFASSNVKVPLAMKTCKNALCVLSYPSECPLFILS